MTSGVVLPGIPHAEYHRRELGVVSKSALERLERSPMHYKSWADGKTDEEPTAALAFGSAMHCAMLEPERFEHQYAVEPDFGDCRFKENKATRDAWREENARRTLLTATDDATIRGMAKAVREHPLASRMVVGGESEVTVRWTDAETGISCKCRADYYVRKHGMVIDLKSTTDASEKAFRRDVAKYGYDVQNVLYRAGFAAAAAPATHFVFVAIEKEPPYAIGVYTLDERWHQAAYVRVRRLMATMRECVASNDWPGYFASIKTLEMPPWMAA